MHHAWLIHGSKGLGKGLFARGAAAWLLAQSAGPAFDGNGFDVPADHPVARLVKEQSHPDYRLVTRLYNEKTDKLSRDISIDQIRSMQHVLENKPALSERRVVVIDSLDELNANGANALLKALEEPPKGTIFLLVSHSPGALLPTIRSRCFPLKLSELSQNDMVKVLDGVTPALDDTEKTGLIKIAGGIPGLALSYSEQDFLALHSALERILSTGDPNMRERISLAKNLSAKASSERLELFLDHVPRFIAKMTRTSKGDLRAQAIHAWEKASDLGSATRRLTLDPYMAVFELGSLVAGLAPK